MSPLASWRHLALCVVAILHPLVGVPGADATSTSHGLTKRPTIRLAHIFSSDNYFTHVEYMMDLFNTPNRTILPDFDVEVHPMSYTPNSGGASVRVVEALLAPEPYHAITGPWANIDCLDTVHLTQQARILQVMKGENAEFTYQRSKFPYVFRVLRSMDGILRIWFFLLLSNGWRSLLSVWEESTTLDLAATLSDAFRIENFAILADSSEDWLVEAWQSSSVAQIRQQRMRTVMTYLASPASMFRFACYVHRQRIGGLQYFTSGTYDPGWYLADYSAYPVLGDCTPDEMYVAVGGYITTVHTVLAPGVTLMGFVESPVLDTVQDQSQRRLTCMPDTTVNDYYGIDLLLRGEADRAIDTFGELQRFIGESGSDTDMVCASLLALHDAIYSKGISLESIEKREEAAFEAIIQSVSDVDFQGPAGEFRFYNDSGDPEVIYYVLLQLARPGFLNDSAVPLALVTYPNGPRSFPRVQLYDESKPLLWRDGSEGLGPDKGHLELFRDCAEENAELIWDECSPCAPGTAHDPLLDACRRCDTGEYQGEVGTSACLTALPGRYVNNTLEPTEATPCPPGSECPQFGTVSPQPCFRGRFADQEGLAECKLCQQGTYQDMVGATACLPCGPILDGSTTVNIASTSPSECICPEGTFRLDADNRCTPCLKGMVCPEGSDARHLLNRSLTPAPADEAGATPYPLVDVGYMTLPVDPLKVYLCRHSSQCPGGDPGSCSQNRDASAVACGKCLDSMYEDTDDCRPCGTAETWPIILSFVIGAGAMFFAAFALNANVHKVSSASLTIVAIIGMLLTSVQALGVFNQIAIPWNEPVKTILRLCLTINFDMETLKVSCVMGVDPVRAFAFRQLVPMFAIPLVAAAVLAKKIMHQRMGRQRVRVWVECGNALGALFTFFFISIMISALNPFLCYRHPNGNGESVLSDPSVLCFDSSEHASMIAVGLGATLLIPLPFLALCGCGVLMYPRRIASLDSSAFLHVFRFLFFRYNPQRYYFLSCLLTRSLLLCLVPALFRGQPAVQVLFMCTILGSYSIITALLQPWRSQLANPLDAAMNMTLLIILTCGAFFMEDTPQRAALQFLTVLAVILLFSMAVAGIFIAAKRRVLPHKFTFFVCHHKAHAAAQARYMKMLLQKKKPVATVFIDSDDLQELDTLFDIVKSRVQHLVVYLTADTLKRPWCAGEIVSAYHAKIQVTRLTTSSFVHPQEEELENPDLYVDSIGCNLSEYGIQWTDITEAFRHFLSQVKQFTLSKTALGTRRFDIAAGMLLGSRKDDVDTYTIPEVKQASVLISTYAGSDEANAAGGILLALMAKDVYQVCEEKVCLLADHYHTIESAQALARQADVVIAILTAGCLESASFLAVICEAEQRQSFGQSVAIIPVSTASFIFPAATFYEDVSGISALEADFGDAVAELLRAFFKHIAVLLPTHASQHSLDTHAKQVFFRLKQHLGKKKGLPNSSATGFGGSSLRDSSGSYRVRGTTSAGRSTSKESSAMGRSKSQDSNPLSPVLPDRLVASNRSLASTPSAPCSPPLQAIRESQNASFDEADLEPRQAKLIQVLPDGTKLDDALLLQL